MVYVLLSTVHAGHFQSDHHPCPHPSCLERKFVVFAEEQDLKRHFATEHGSEMNMSRAQRRQVGSVSCSKGGMRVERLLEAGTTVWWLVLCGQLRGHALRATLVWRCHGVLVHCCCETLLLIR